MNNPIGTYDYRVPSGATCDVVFGDVRIVERSDRERRDQIERDLQSWFESADVAAVAVAQIDEYLPRAERMTIADVDDRDDLVYRTAVDLSVSDQAMTELERLGYARDVESYGAQGYCPELDR